MANRNDMMGGALDASLVGDGRTIAAIASAHGRAAVALVRMSGPDVRALGTALLSPMPTVARRATRCTVRSHSGDVIDDAIATFYPGPHSFTGEDVLEISTHGGSAAPLAVLTAAIRAGAREAEPGEFTRRAVLNGKIDLLQAEAIGDLIDARSSVAHRMALRQLDGGLSRRIAEIREEVLGLEALLAYDIDFPEEDDGPIPRERIAATTEALLVSLDALLATSEEGMLVHEGALIVFAGAPNAGKSSLFNALLGEARAIVTEVPGTTRDAIEAVLDLPGWPLRLVDTAGLRDTSDSVERLGIETSERYLARASVILACVDSGESVQAIDKLRNESSAAVIVVATKSDLAAHRAQIQADIAVSAHTGEGLASLLELIEVRLAGLRGLPMLDAPMLTRARHRVAVDRARSELAQFAAIWTSSELPVIVAATHVHTSANALSELIGDIRVDDVLDVVFRSFCVGK